MANLLPGKKLLPENSAGMHDSANQGLPPFSGDFCRKMAGRPGLPHATLPAMRVTRRVTSTMHATDAKCCRYLSQMRSTALFRFTVPNRGFCIRIGRNLPDIDPLTICFNDLQKWIREFDRFNDDPAASNECKPKAVPVA